MAEEKRGMRNGDKGNVLHSLRTKIVGVMIMAMV